MFQQWWYLLSFLIKMDTKGGIFLLEAIEGFGHFICSAFVCGMDGQRNNGFRDVHRCLRCCYRGKAEILFWCIWMRLRLSFWGGEKRMNGVGPNHCIPKWSVCKSVTRVTVNSKYSPNFTSGQFVNILPPGINSTNRYLTLANNIFIWMSRKSIQYGFTLMTTTHVATKQNITGYLYLICVNFEKTWDFELLVSVDV